MDAAKHCWPAPVAPAAHLVEGGRFLFAVFNLFELQRRTYYTDEGTEKKIDEKKNINK